MSPLRRIATAVLLSTLAAGATAAAGDEKLGSVSFPNSCAEAAQPYLQRAVALLHSFWWEQADAVYADALRRDPTCAIATWGIATVAIGNPFGAGATRRAKGRRAPPTRRLRRGNRRLLRPFRRAGAWRAAALGCGRVRSAGAKISGRRRDADFPRPLFDRDAIADGQNSVARGVRRGDPESAVRQTPGSSGRGVLPDPQQRLSVDRRQRVGGGHVLCGYRAGSAARAAHALAHFHAGGLWQQLADTNQRSVDAAKPANGITDQLHAYDYVVYAYLQLARDRDALCGLEAAGSLAEPNRAADYARAAIPARYAIERGAWRAAAQLGEPDTSKFPYTGAIRVFARALGTQRRSGCRRA